MDLKALFRKPLHFDKLKFFYVQNFFFGLSSFVAPVVMVYFLLIGFDYFQNSILFAVWVGSQFLFEIPTGAIADIYGRKLSVFLSYLFCGILAILLASSSSFYILLVLVFFIGGASTLSSGADKAWMVDYVKQKKLGKDLQKIFSNIHSYDAVGSLIAFAISTYLIYLNVRYV
ncbi:MAG: MFS transporter, partial [Candidatus Aenigmarchaeota archaeon]|nr:MFS transporter [Candidatus Aenigmarchaeota archaeon]